MRIIVKLFCYFHSHNIVGLAVVVDHQSDQGCSYLAFA